jgi:hypothetical protein
MYERTFMINLLKALIMPSAPTLQMLMHGHSVHATTKTPSFGTRPNIPQIAKVADQTSPKSII